MALQATPLVHSGTDAKKGALDSVATVIRNSYSQLLFATATVAAAKHLTANGSLALI